MLVNDNTAEYNVSQE